MNNQISLPPLTPKQLRSIERILQKVHSSRGVLAVSKFEDFKLVEKFGGDVWISGRQVFVTNEAMDALRDLNQMLQAVLLPCEFFSGDDVWNAVLSESKANLSDGLRPTAPHFLETTLDRIRELQGEFTYAADFEGVDLEDLDEVVLGRARMCKPDPKVLNAFQRLGPLATQPKSLLKQSTWFMGTYRGTPSATRINFELDASMASGVIGIAATVCYENGFLRSRPLVHVKAHDPGGTANTLRWSGEFSCPELSFGGRRGIPIGINAELHEYLISECKFKQIFAIVQRSERNEVEEAVARSIYWFAQAHRDSELAMRYVKLWSCIESFFAFENTKLTERNAMGVATVLVFGDYHAIPVSEYEATRRRLKQFYAQRSKAIHRAEHRHIDAGLVRDLSYWAAWCIFTFASFADRGYGSLKQVWENVERLDTLVLQHSRPIAHP
jgi:hypothetical protein